ncbi:MAG: transglycosylase domain-containing protein [Rhizobiaceae bacterium]
MITLPSLAVRGVDALDRLERHRYGTGLPSAEEVGDLSGRCQVTAVFGPEAVLCPTALGIDRFSPFLVAAVQASEDRRFRWHDGVDRVAILRAIVGYFGPGSASGGSTISQQVARTLFLNRHDRWTGWDDDLGWMPGWTTVRADLAAFDRKRKEWIVARRLEAALDKKTILAAYLNVAPHAEGLFGFEAAARRLFGKHAQDLALDESAMLVAMLPAPNARHPARNAERLAHATGGVLADMVDGGYISKAEARVAADTARRKLESGRVFGGNGRLRASARRPFEHRRLRDLAREQAVLRGVDLGRTARLFLTLSPEFQAMADDAAAGSPRGYVTSSVFIDRRGEVLAVAGPDYAAAQYNAAFESRRSIGSIGKAMLHAAALETGELAERQYATSPLDGYSPREDSRWCRGAMAPAAALAHSCNRPFVRLAAALGPKAGAMVRDFGFDVPDNPLLIATGGVHANALTATRMIAAFGNGGWLRDPVAFAGALDADGRTIAARPAPEPRRVLSDKVAYRMMVDLRGPVTADHGTARAAAGKSRAAHVSGKTGTSNKGRDAWFVGFTADFAGSVVAQSERGGTMTGGSYPAQSFGSVVDGYWMRRNWLAGPAGQAAQSQPVPGLEPTPARIRALGPELLRILAMVGGAIWLILLMRRPRARSERPPLPGDVAAPSAYVPPGEALRSRAGA